MPLHYWAKRTKLNLRVNTSDALGALALATLSLTTTIAAGAALRVQTGRVKVNRRGKRSVIAKRTVKTRAVVASLIVSILELLVNISAMLLLQLKVVIN